MQIKLHYRPAAGDNRFGEGIQIREFEVPNQADIRSILPQIHGKGLARWVNDQYGGHVEGDYMDTGKLEENVTYHILSANIQKTINAMKSLKKLKI